MIRYDKLVKLLSDNNVNTYTIKKNSIIGQASWDKIHNGGNIDMRTVDKLCAYLHCQPGDMLEYVPDVDKAP